MNLKNSFFNTSIVFVVCMMMFCLVFPMEALAQKSAELIELNANRNNISQKGMFVLGSWAVGNIAYSGVMASRTNGRDRYFHQMNVYWNLVNAAIAGFGYYGSVTAANDLGLYETSKEHFQIQKILLLNAGLDLAYVAGGFYMKERANRPNVNQERLRGFGDSLILQGGFLFVFDVILYTIHTGQNDALKSIMSNVSVQAQGLTLNIPIY